ncbi:MAG: DUF433 domain-containing protein [Moorea sp. SIO2B7]|nr:DUF433 domain-containing protein [Moorena sp. SIO2B7]
MIAGTRITLYDVMDHLKAGWTPKLILNWLPLTEEQLNAALSYINANRSDVEAEYQSVLQEDQQRREYWDNKNRERLAEISKMSPSHAKGYRSYDYPHIIPDKPILIGCPSLICHSAMVR